MRSIRFRRGLPLKYFDMVPGKTAKCDVKWGIGLVGGIN